MEQQPQMEAQEEKLFDLRVHIREPKTGKLVDVRPYKLHIIQGTRYFERPVGSWEFFSENGEAVEINKLPAELLINNPKAPKPIQEKAQQKVTSRFADE